MRHIRDEALLQGRQALQLNNLLLQRIGHTVEGNTQTRGLVLALNRHALVQITGGQTLRRDGGLRNRAHHEAGHEPHHGQHHGQQGAETAEQHEVNVRNRLGRIGHVVHGEQTVVRILRDRNVRTHDKHGVGAFAVILKRCNSGGLPIHAVPIANGVLEIRGDARRV